MLEPVLEIADSVMTYRRMYFDRPRLSGVLAVVAGDESNPRSLAFQLKTLAEHASVLAIDRKPTAGEPELVRIAALLRAVHGLTLNEWSGSDELEAGPALMESLRHWAAELAALSDLVTNRYFSHSVPRQS
jgi:uncharacterized alpha-E superfamily protein